MSGKTGKAVMAGINLVLFFVIVVGAYWGWRKLQANNAKVAEINRLQRVFGEHQWQEVADGLEALFVQYPETRQGYGDQLGVAYQFLAEEKYQAALRLQLEERKQAMVPVIELLEKAREHVSLNENSLFALCDCYMDRQEYDKALVVIAEVERREQAGEEIKASRFHIQKAFIARQTKK